MYVPRSVRPTVPGDVSETSTWPAPASPAMTPWPALPPAADWAPTRETAHRWLQTVGKVRLAHAPLGQPRVARPALRHAARADHVDGAPRRDPVRGRARLPGPRLDLGPRRARPPVAAAARHVGRRPDALAAGRAGRRRRRDAVLAHARRDPGRRGAAGPGRPRRLRPRRDGRLPRRLGPGRPRAGPVPAPASSASAARFTCSGAPSTWPSPGSPARRRRPTPAAPPTSPTG